jgi:hypothetical protein
MATRVGSVCDKVRPGGGQVLSEAVATLCVILVIRLASRLAPESVPGFLLGQVGSVLAATAASAGLLKEHRAGG